MNFCIDDNQVLMDREQVELLNCIEIEEKPILISIIVNFLSKPLGSL